MISKLDAEIKIELEIGNIHSEFSLVQVEIPYLNKIIEVKIPNNIQIGYKVKLKELGYVGNDGKRGDLYIIVSKIIYKSLNENEDKMLRIMQSILFELKTINEKLDNIQQIQFENPVLDISHRLTSIESLVSKIEENQWNLR